mmetsp:Transcript_70180/g.212349  ORF Transcript_70180/g.212349 Transcript_70180/m.212349 type:complete len:246 (-) Transcript_70180:30-767(-)
MGGAGADVQGVRPAVAQLPGLGWPQRGLHERGHDHVLRREDAHLQRDQLAQAHAHRSIRGLLHPVRAAHLLLQLPPQAGRAHQHDLQSLRQHHALHAGVRRPLLHARVHGALDARRVHRRLRDLRRRDQGAGADDIRGVHPGERGDRSPWFHAGHVLDLRRHVYAHCLDDDAQLLPCHRRECLCGREGREPEEHRRQGRHHGPLRRRPVLYPRVTRGLALAFQAPEVPRGRGEAPRGGAGHVRPQ